MSNGHVFQPPDPEGSPREKLLVPKKDRALWKLERQIRHSGLDPQVADNLVRAFTEYETERQYEDMKNFESLEYWANRHTHPGGFAGADFIDLMTELNPLFWWRFEETSGDTSLDEMHQAPMIIADLNYSSLDVSGILGSGIHLDGLEGGWDDGGGARYTYDSEENYPVLSVGEFTLVIWVKVIRNPTGFQSATRCALLQSVSLSNGRRLSMGFNDVGYPTILVNNPNTSTPTPFIWETTIDDGNWHCLVGQFTVTEDSGSSAPSQPLKLFVDGELRLSEIGQNATEGNRTTVAILSPSGNVDNGEVDVDEVAIFDRHLTDQEINSLWTSGSTDDLVGIEE